MSLDSTLDKREGEMVMITVRYNWDAAKVVNRELCFDSYRTYQVWLNSRIAGIIILSTVQHGEV